MKLIRNKLQENTFAHFNLLSFDKQVYSMSHRDEDLIDFGKMPD